MKTDSQFPDESIDEYLEMLKRLLVSDSPRQQVVLTGQWARGFPAGPGAYAVFEADSLIYAGETGSLRSRMSDLLDSRHHTLRRSLGEDRFSQEPGYSKATSKKKFPPTIEAQVDRLLKDRMTVSVLPVRLGRKELEEAIVDTFKPPFNKKGRRGE